MYSYPSENSSRPSVVIFIHVWSYDPLGYLIMYTLTEFKYFLIEVTTLDSRERGFTVIRYEKK